MNIIHHGAIDGVTGSCHQLNVEVAHPHAILIDCGLFQGDDRPPNGQATRLVEFDVAPIEAVVLTHVHIDHVGRLPYLLAAGYTGPILASQASAKLLPMVLADALKVGVTRDREAIERVLAVVDQQLIGLKNHRWHPVSDQVTVRLQPAGHILGSSYVELHVDEQADHSAPVDPEGRGQRVVFSGDLGPADAPLLPAPVAPERADVLVLESTYGDRLHADRHRRQAALQAAIEHALINDGTVLIPAFSIGRTQVLLYELEDVFARWKGGPPWDRLQIILDSPLAADYTEGYQQLRHLWDEEAQARAAKGRHPLAFDQLMTIDSHAEHLKMVSFLKKTGHGAVVIAASGMCTGGRVVNYLKALLGDARSDVIFVGYQAPGTPGREILTHGTRAGEDGRPGWVSLDGERYTIEAAIHEISGYSAHADQAGLVAFVRDIPRLPDEVRLVHGDVSAKASLKRCLEDELDAQVSIPGSVA